MSRVDPQIKDLYVYMLKMGGNVDSINEFDSHLEINLDIAPENYQTLTDAYGFSVLGFGIEPTGRTIMLGDYHHLTDGYGFSWPQNRYFGHSFGNVVSYGGIGVK